MFLIIKDNLGNGYGDNSIPLYFEQSGYHMRTTLGTDIIYNCDLSYSITDSTVEAIQSSHYSAGAVEYYYENKEYHYAFCLMCGARWLEHHKSDKSCCVMQDY